MKIIKFMETPTGYSMDSSCYSEYVESVRSLIPKETLEFMEADWHYNHRDERCLHDAHIKELSIVATDNKLDVASKFDLKKVNIKMSLLGAYGHDITLFYDGVLNYSIIKEEGEYPGEKDYHGDWLIDEILLTEDGYMTHEIIFEYAKINIKCKWLKYDISDISDLND